MSGWFGSMDRYDHHGGNRNAYDRSFYLEAYKGGPYSVKRINRGNFIIPNLSLTIIGGMQPELIRKFSKGASDDGLIQRLTPIMLQPAATPISNSQTAEDIDSFAVLIVQLLGLQPPENTERRLRFDRRAQEIQRDLAEEHRLLVKGFEGFNGKLSTALGKQDALFARFCIVWHAVDHAGGDPVLPPIVSENTAQRVATFMRQFTRQHLHDFCEDVLSLPEEHERLKSIAGLILSKNLKFVSNRHIQASVRLARHLTSKEVTEVLVQLEMRGWLSRGEASRTGAPPNWIVNPRVHKLFEARAKTEVEQREEMAKLLAQKFSVRRHPNEEGV
jgi:hypothetical protein